MSLNIEEEKIWFDDYKLLLGKNIEIDKAYVHCMECLIECKTTQEYANYFSSSNEATKSKFYATLISSTEQFKGGIKKNFTNYFASDECRVMRNLVENSFDTSMYDMNKVFLGYSNEILQKFQNDLARTTKNYQDAKDEFIKLAS